MASVPQRYLYILDMNTGEPLVILPVDHFDSEYDIERYAEVLCRTHRIAEASTRLALKDSLAEPLDDALLKEKFRFE